MTLNSADQTATRMGFLASFITTGLFRRAGLPSRTSNGRKALLYNNLLLHVSIYVKRIIWANCSTSSITSIPPATCKSTLPIGISHKVLHQVYRFSWPKGLLVFHQPTREKTGAGGQFACDSRWKSAVLLWEVWTHLEGLR